MTRNIAEAVAELKSSIRESLDPQTIENACERAGHTWRDRVLGPVTTIWMFALQIVHANTACKHVVRLMPEVSATDSAYCQARRRIPLAAFQALFKLVTRRLVRSIDGALERWHGHRVFFIDGSSCSMPDTPSLQATFGQPTGQKKGCGFPTATIVALFHGRSGLLIDMLIEPLCCHEASLAPRLFKWLRRTDVLVGDRAFASYVALAMLCKRGAEAVMRQHQHRPVDFRRGQRIAQEDQVIELTKPSKAPHWMDPGEFEQLPDRLTVRQIRYRIMAKGYRTQSVVVVTTLLDGKEYPLDELATLYGERWEVETSFRHLKQTLRMDVLRCQTPDGVCKELYIYGVVYNLVRTIMVKAGLLQGVPPERISFIDVVRCLAIGSLDLDSLPRFVVNPHRPGRHQPRAVKRRPKQYPRLTHPRSQMRKAMTSWKL